MVLRFIFFFLILAITGCHQHQETNEPDLVQVQIIDQNGLTETVSSDDRLEKYKNTDFLEPQPFQKVVRIYKRNSEGHVASHLTCYYPNGQIKQYLEAKDLRANGEYKEWYPNGKLKILAHVIGGGADFNSISQKDWLFEGKTKAYDEQGNMVAQIPYEKGALSGKVFYYFPNKFVKTETPYKDNQIHGEMKEYYPSGSLKKKNNYQFNLLDGISLTYWENETPQAIEEYQKGFLKQGVYYKRNGKTICEIHDGNGIRFLPLEDKSYQLQEYRKGEQEGRVQTFLSNGKLKNVCTTKNEKKHGREVEFYLFNETPLDDSGSVMKYSLDWIEDKVHGSVKTWYPNAVMESQKQFSYNKKNGASCYWFNDGSLMAVEEYENDLLVSGKYFKKGDSSPVSEIHEGSGLATIYDEEGIFLEKIPYQNGKPLVTNE